MKIILIAAALAASMVSAHAAFVKDMTPEQIKAEVAAELKAGHELDIILRAAAEAGINPDAILDSYIAIVTEQSGSTAAGLAAGRPAFATSAGSTFSGGGGGAASRN